MNKSMIIEPDKFIDILSIYYSIKERKHISFYYNIDVIDDGVNIKPDIKIYHSCCIIGEKITVKLTPDEIFEPLKVYAYNNGIELEDYKFIGNVRNIGYFADSQVPLFEGVKLTGKKLSKTKIRKK